MLLEFRRALPTDVAAIAAIIEQGRRSLQQRGVDQWQNNQQPGVATLAEDVEEGQGYVVTADGTVVATVALLPGGEPAYHQLLQGAWHTSGPYLAIHRIAVATAHRGGGVAGFLMQNIQRLAQQLGLPAIRVDTHRDNLAMQRFLAKHGFAYCGEVHYAAEGLLRLGFEKVL